jgi:hypothetical protein
LYQSLFDKNSFLQLYEASATVLIFWLVSKKFMMLGYTTSETDAFDPMCQQSISIAKLG